MIALYILLVLAGVVGAGAAYQRIGLVRDRRRYPAPGQFIEVNGQRLHIYAQGEGSPTVVLEAGIAATSLSWRLVDRAIAKFTRVVEYDRAGLGWSGRLRTPRTAQHAARELHELLQRAGEQPPFVLVGHSFGGLVVREFAAAYAEEVAGLVLVDPFRPQQWTPLTPLQRRMVAGGVFFSRWGGVLARVGVVRGCLSLAMSGRSTIPKIVSRASAGPASSVTDRMVGQVQKLPCEVWPIVAAHWADAKSFVGMAEHLRWLPESAAAWKGTPCELPVTLITGVRAEPGPSDEAARIGACVRHVVAERSGHWVQLDQPELVIEAVREMVTAVREHRWPAGADRAEREPIPPTHR